MKLLCVLAIFMATVCSFMPFAYAHNQNKSLDAQQSLYLVNAIPCSVKNNHQETITVARRAASRRALRMRYRRK